MILYKGSNFVIKFKKISYICICKIALAVAIVRLGLHTNGKINV